MCISLRGHSWVNKFVGKSLIKFFSANAQDIADVYIKTQEAFAYSRSYSRPALILYQNITRRFGHAATDRQIAYMKPEEIEAAANADNLSRMITEKNIVL